MKKAVRIVIIVTVATLTLFIVFMAIRVNNSKSYEVGDDEIALYIQLDTEEDIGLLVFDYSINEAEHSGGISNADKSLLKHDEQLINVWNKEDLKCSADTVNLSIKFRIITEYVDPNYENIYPENLTKVLESISFEAHFGEAYSFTITGNNMDGYRIIQN